MGACCCGMQSSRAHIVSSGTTTEPLLKETEREAVTAILKFLDSGKSHITHQYDRQIEIDIELKTS